MFDHGWDTRVECRVRQETEVWRLVLTRLFQEDLLVDEGQSLPPVLFGPRDSREAIIKEPPLQSTILGDDFGCVALDVRLVFKSFTGPQVASSPLSNTDPIHLEIGRSADVRLHRPMAPL